MTNSKGSVERAVGRIIPAFMRPAWERLRASNIGYRIAHGAFWSTIGAGMSQALMLLISIIAARILGKEQFGQYGIIISTVGMFSIFTGFGLGTTATRFVAEYKRTAPDRAGRIIALSSLIALGTGTLAAIILIIIAPWLSAKILAAPQLSDMLRLAAGLVFFSAVNGAQTGILAGFEAFRGIARINLISGIFSFILTGAGVFFWGIAGALTGQTAAVCLSCLIASFALRSEARRFGVQTGYAGCMKERSVLLSFTMPAVLSGIMVSPITWACSAILVNQPSGYAEMGIFNAACSWQKAILFLPGCLAAISLPMLSEFRGANDWDGYGKALRYNLLLNGTAAFAAFVSIVLFSKLIMKSYGDSFEAGYVVLILLSFSSVLMAVGSVIGNAIASAGRMWFAFIFNALWGMSYITLAAVLVPKYGAMGLALSNVGAYLLHSCWQLMYLKKI